MAQNTKEITTDPTQLGMLTSTFLVTVRRLKEKAEAMECCISAGIEFDAPLVKSDLSIYMRLYRRDSSGALRTVLGSDHDGHADFSLEYLSECASRVEHALDRISNQDSTREEEIERQMEALRREKRDIQRKRKQFLKTNGNVEH